MFENNRILLRKFCAVLWKNWKIGVARPKTILTNIFLPILCAMLLVTQRLAHEVITCHPINFEPFSTNISLVRDLINEAIEYQGRHLNKMRWEIAFSPPHKFLEILINRTCKSISRGARPERFNFTYSMHDNSDDLETYLMKNENVFVGVQFQDDYADMLPESNNNFRFELRFPYNLRTNKLRYITKHTSTWRTNDKYSDINANVPTEIKSSIGNRQSAAYVAEGFTLMVNEIGLNFVEMMGNLPEPIPRPYFQRYPHGEYILDEFVKSGDFYISFWIVISGFWSFGDSIYHICKEKEKQVKEILKIAGISNWMQWMAWFLVAFGKHLLTRVLILIMFITRMGSFPAILTYCNPFVYYFLQIVYSFNLTTLAFLISVIFKKTESAVFFGRTIYFLLAVPYFVAREWYYIFPAQLLMFISMFSHSGYGLGVHVIYLYEKKGQSQHFMNLFKSPDDTKFHLGHVLCFMFLGGVLHIICLLYLEKVRPGRYGIPFKWNFLLTKAFWCRRRLRRQVESFELGDMGSRASLFQAVDIRDSRKGITVAVDHLTKSFGKLVAVKELTLRVFNGELVVLLGFTKSGKSVTMSMLAGLLKPTSGSIYIEGYDLLHDPVNARQSLGYVPQDDIYIDNLTVRENIIFYCRIRGLSRYRSEFEVKKYLSLMDLSNYGHVLASTLQKHQKRKLSIVSGFCGGTKIVFIDTPCRGMDPKERKKIWQMLHSEKPGRTIVITTTLIDEGEKLADKIGILSRGKLEAYGTPSFVKRKFGKGHILVVFKGKNYQSKNVKDHIKRYISDYEIVMENEAEVHFELKNDYVHLFPRLLEELEKQSALLNIRSITIRTSTTEESYLSFENKRFTHSGLDGEFMTYEPQYKLKLLRSQILGMLYKKILFYRYNIRYITCQFVIILFSVVLLYFTSNALVQPLKRLHLIIDPHEYSPASVSVDILDNPELSLIYEDYMFEHFPEVKIDRIHKNTNTNDFLLSKYRYGTPYIYYTKHVAGISHNKNMTVIYFNNYFFHSIAISQCIAINVLSQMYLKHKNHLIDVVNNPLPHPSFEHDKMKHVVLDEKISNAYIITWFSLAIGIFIICPINERTMGFVQQQYVHGVPPVVYWLSHFILDFLIFEMIAISYIIFGFASGFEELYNAFYCLRFLVILTFFGLSSISFLYLLSKWIESPVTGMGIVYLIYLTFGFMISILVLELIKLTTGDAELIFTILHYIFSFIPTYGLYCAMMKIHSLTFHAEMCHHKCHTIKDINEELCHNFVEGHKMLCSQGYDDCCYVSSFHLKGGLIKEIGFFFLFATMCLLTVILADAKIFIRKVDPTELEYNKVEVDVMDEKIRVASISRKKLFQTTVVLKDVTKLYNQKVVVKNLTMRIEDGESFGFLGLHGSGKSCILKILAGETIPNRGGAYIKGRSLITKKKICRKEIGFCPGGGFYDDFTVKQYLKLFLIIRGYNKEDRIRLIKEFSESFLYNHRLHQKLANCSTFTKKKINLSVALIGAPKLILIDEPTRGMDPLKRIVIWKMITGMRNFDKTLVITTFNVDEADYLCDRFGILVNGEMINVGNTNEFVSKHGEAWMLTIRINENYLQSQIRQGNYIDFFQKLDEFVRLSFFGSTLREKIGSSFEYYIPIVATLGIRWSRVFRILENNKQRFNVDDYSVRTINIRDVYILKTEGQIEKTPHW